MAREGVMVATAPSKATVQCEEFTANTCSEDFSLREREMRGERVREREREREKERERERERETYRSFASKTQVVRWANS